MKNYFHNKKQEQQQKQQQQQKYHKIETKIKNVTQKQKHKIITEKEK